MSNQHKINRARDIAKVREEWEARYRDPDATPGPTATAAEREYYQAVCRQREILRGRLEAVDHAERDSTLIDGADFFERLNAGEFEEPIDRLIRRVRDIQTFADEQDIDLNPSTEQVPVTIEDLRNSFERAREAADKGELRDMNSFFNALDRLDILIDQAYEACELAYDELSPEDQQWLDNHPKDKIVGHEFFELRALQKDISRARHYADTEENRKAAEEKLQKAKQRKRPRIKKSYGRSGT